MFSQEDPALTMEGIGVRETLGELLQVTHVIRERLQVIRLPEVE